MTEVGRAHRQPAARPRLASRDVGEVDARAVYFADGASRCRCVAKRAQSGAVAQSVPRWRARVARLPRLRA
jgi:hypothetical protein